MMMMNRLVPVLAVAAATLLSSPAGAHAPSARSLRAIHRVHNHCNTWSCVRRVRHARAARARRRVVRTRALTVAPYRAWLASVRWCESTNRYWLSTGNGFYGAYQFTLSSWRSVGGWGMPNAAPPLEQDYRAVLLLHSQGRGAWPVCG
jgi:hypothetical protein